MVPLVRKEVLQYRVALIECDVFQHVLALVCCPWAPSVAFSAFAGGPTVPCLLLKWVDHTYTNHKWSFSFQLLVVPFFLKVWEPFRAAMAQVSRRAVRTIMKASNAGQAHLVSLTAHICLYSVSKRCFGTLTRPGQDARPFLATGFPTHWCRTRC